jgi:hypothetical protein
VRARLGLAAFVLVAALGLAALLLASATDRRSIAFSLDVPDIEPVLSVEPGQAVCESPIETTVAFAGIRAWPVPAAPPGAGFAVTVRDARSERILATGRMTPGYATTTPRTAALDATVPVGRRVEVCLRSTGPQRAGLLGAAPSPEPVTVTVAGKRSAIGVSLIFLRRHPPSLLSLVPTIFRRAALFRPGWVGAWTFWILTGALLGAFVLGARALIDAIREDGDDREDTGP